MLYMFHIGLFWVLAMYFYCATVVCLVRWLSIFYCGVDVSIAICSAIYHVPRYFALCFIIEMVHVSLVAGFAKALSMQFVVVLYCYFIVVVLMVFVFYREGPPLLLLCTVRHRPSSAAYSFRDSRTGGGRQSQQPQQLQQPRPRPQPMVHQPQPARHQPAPAPPQPPPTEPAGTHLLR